jgi:hypothetical protein
MVDITKTRAQLLERAGINLGLVQPGEALSSEDYDTLDNLVDPLIEQLSADNVIYMQDPDAIDVAIFLPLAALLANSAGPSFGSPINDQAMRAIPGHLRRINSTKPLYTPIESRNTSRWSRSAWPDLDGAGTEIKRRRRQAYQLLRRADGRRCTGDSYVIHRVPGLSCLRNECTRTGYRGGMSWPACFMRVSAANWRNGPARAGHQPMSAT